MNSPSCCRSTRPWPLLLLALLPGCVAAVSAGAADLSRTAKPLAKVAALAVASIDAAAHLNLQAAIDALPAGGGTVRIPPGTYEISTPLIFGTGHVLFEGAGAVEATVYDRARLLQGNVIDGPAIIEDVASTTVVEPGDTVTVNAYGHLIMSLGGSQ